MIEDPDNLLKPFVLAIAGYVGSGKSTVATSLSRVLGNAPVLVFDHYEKFVEWPQDMGQWICEGADPGQIRIPKLKEDLLNLIQGLSIADPMDGKLLVPGEVILLEEPSGREREEIREYIDLVVYIDVPQDLCVVRLIERVIDLGVWNSRETFSSESKDDLVRQLDAVAGWLTHYQQVRSMYSLVSHRVQQNADLIVDGMKTVEEITAEIVKGIHARDTLRKT